LADFAFADVLSLCASFAEAEAEAEAEADEFDEADDFGGGDDDDSATDCGADAASLAAARGLSLGGADVDAVVDAAVDTASAAGAGRSAAVGLIDGLLVHDHTAPTITTVPTAAAIMPVCERVLCRFASAASCVAVAFATAASFSAYACPARARVRSRNFSAISCTPTDEPKL
jgi:hypothetical protein